MFYFKISTVTRYLIYSLLAIYPLGCSPNVSQPLTSQPLNKQPQEQKETPLASPSPSIQRTQSKSANSVLPIAKNPKPNSIFRPIFPALKYETKIPILLPTYIPESEKPNQVFAILKKSTLTQYEIILSSTENCFGEEACRLGSISGKEDVSKPISGLQIINLNENTTAYFKASKCTDVCSDATLSWNQGKYLYTFAIKNGSQDILIKIANSTIANGSL